MILVDTLKVVVIRYFLPFSMKKVILEATNVAHGFGVELSLIIVGLVINHVAIIIRAVVKDIISETSDRAIIKLSNQDIAIFLCQYPVSVRFLVLNYD